MLLRPFIIWNKERKPAYYRHAGNFSFFYSVGACVYIGIGSLMYLRSVGKQTQSKQTTYSEFKTDFSKGKYVVNEQVAKDIGSLTTLPSSPNSSVVQ